MGPFTLADAISLGALLIVAVLLFLLLFEPGVAYRVRSPSARVDSKEFVDYLSAVLNARAFAHGDIEVLNGGERTYAAELAAIRAAKHSIHLEAYLFLRGRVADEM